jgi:antitoxin component YwqK of YwqJK toxin-antitoxin module
MISTGKYGNRLIIDFIMYHENGKIASKTKYQFGKADGEQFYYYNNGNKETEATFIDDLRHGRIITYGYDGAVQQIRTYDRGVLLSYTYLDKNGKELPPIQLGKGENSFTVFYQNGNKAVEQTRFNGKIHGKYTEYYSDGKVMTEGNYYYGEENGPYLQYHPNGNKKVEENYKYGELDGVSSEYHLNGMLKKTSVYRMGELHGERKVYYNDQMLEVK